MKIVAADEIVLWSPASARDKARSLRIPDDDSALAVAEHAVALDNVVAGVKDGDAVLGVPRDAVAPDEIAVALAVHPDAGAILSAQPEPSGGDGVPQDAVVARALAGAADGRVIVGHDDAVDKVPAERAVFDDVVVAAQDD